MLFLSYSTLDRPAGKDVDTLRYYLMWEHKDPFKTKQNKTKQNKTKQNTLMRANSCSVQPVLNSHGE